jgi:hypothetical protein
MSSFVEDYPHSTRSLFKKINALNYMQVLLLSYTERILFDCKDTPKRYDLKIIERTTSTFKDWDAMRRDVYTLSSSNACKGKVGDPYVFVLRNKQVNTAEALSAQIAPWKTEAFPPPKHDVYATLPPRRNVMMVGYKNNQPFGFLLGNATKQKAYVDVICGSPGAPILEAFLHWSKKREVRLSALLNVLGYYPKFGFEFGKCGANPHLLENVKALPKEAFDNVLDLSPAAMKVTKTLRKKRLVVMEPKGCRGLTSKDYLAQNCFTNGVPMVRCRTRSNQTTSKVR